ncbi:MAG: DUF4364 family protein [Eubacteriales bacterium]
MSEIHTLYKLIILYMLNKLNRPMTNSQISEFILEREYTNYFTIQQVLSESLDANFIRMETTYQRTIYHLTEEGKETIDFFYQDISPAIRDDIDAFLVEKKYDLRDDTDIVANYYRNTSKEYSVHLQVKENNIDVIDLTISVPSESVAESIANNWTKKNQEVYALIMEHLL